MSREILYQGQIIHLKNSPFALLIFPFVQLKKLLKVLYDFLARMMWKELLKGEKSDNEILNIVGFVVFCGLSWLTFFLQGYTRIIFLISLLVWGIDWGWAIASYSHPQHQIQVKLLDLSPESCCWRTQSPNSPKTEIEIDYHALQKLILERKTLKAGAFSHPVGEPWQLSLMTKNAESYFLDRCRDLETLLPKAKQLSDRLQIPLNFADSYGNNPYAIFPLDQFPSVKQPRSPAILLRKSPKRWQVSTRWRWGNSWRLLRQIIQESGFLLFLLILSNYMVKIGGFINSLWVASRGQNEPIILDPISGLNPDFGWNHGIDLAILVSITLYNGWKMSQIRRVQVDRYFLKYLINAKAIAQMRTEQIQALLLLHGDDPELLVVSAKKALSLGHFHQPIESLTFLESLAESIQHFQPDPEPQRDED